MIFGEYILNAAKVEVNRWNQRGVGLACITAAFLIHGCALKWGLRLQNLLGGIKLIIVLLIIVAGWVCQQLAPRVFRHGKSKDDLLLTTIRLLWAVRSRLTNHTTSTMPLQEPPAARELHFSRFPNDAVL